MPRPAHGGTKHRPFVLRTVWPADCSVMGKFDNSRIVSVAVLDSSCANTTADVLIVNLRSWLSAASVSGCLSVAWWWWWCLCVCVCVREREIERDRLWHVIIDFRVFAALTLFSWEDCLVCKNSFVYESCCCSSEASLTVPRLRHRTLGYFWACRLTRCAFAMRRTGQLQRRRLPSAHFPASML